MDRARYSAKFFRHFNRDDYINSFQNTEKAPFLQHESVKSMADYFMLSNTNKYGNSFPRFRNRMNQSESTEFVDFDRDSCRAQNIKITRKLPKKY